MPKNSGVWARFCIASVWCRLPGTDDAGKKTVLPAPAAPPWEGSARRRRDVPLNLNLHVPRRYEDVEPAGSCARLVGDKALQRR